MLLNNHLDSTNGWITVSLVYLRKYFVKKIYASILRFFYFLFFFILARNNFLVFNDLEGCDAVIFSLFWKMGCRKVFSSQLICVCVCYVGIDKEQFIEESL